RSRGGLGHDDLRASYLNRAFFLSDSAWTAFESQVSESTERAEFPPYSALDVFTILAVHFPRRTAGKKDRRDDLAAVLDSSTIPYADDKALSTMIEGLSDWLGRLEIGDVRFQLTEAGQGIWGLPRTISEIEEWQRKTDDRIEA